MTTKNNNAKRETIKTINTLLTQLTSCDDQRMKKQLRAKMRRLGHYGATRTIDTPICTKIDACKRTLRERDETTRQRDE